jgi:hypothetical protein
VDAFKAGFEAESRPIIYPFRSSRPCTAPLPSSSGPALLVAPCLEPSIQVKAITYCHDTYRVTSADGKTRRFWERNLRFMTDSSQDGPEKGAHAIMLAGTLGDRAAVTFAAPEEIAKMVESRC